MELYTHPVITGFPEELQCFDQATNERFKHFQHQTKKVYKSSHQDFQRSLSLFNLLKPLTVIAHDLSEKWPALISWERESEQCIFNPLPVSFQCVCVCVCVCVIHYSDNSHNEPMWRRKGNFFTHVLTCNGTNPLCACAHLANKADSEISQQQKPLCINSINVLIIQKRACTLKSKAKK